jgi:hypothetical protein
MPDAEDSDATRKCLIVDDVIAYWKKADIAITDRRASFAQLGMCGEPTKNIVKSID